jgi:HEAT repeat protein
MLDSMPVRKVDQEIEQLGQLRDAPESGAVPGLSKALTDRVNLMVAKAAKIAAERKLHALVPNLLRSYDRLFENPTQRDPQCWGKNAIAQALVDLDYHESAPFVRGIRHVQMEPVWGGREDTATTLRSICALALPACADLARPDVLRLLVDALGDPADPVRVDTVRALGQMEGDEAVLLLRLKARLGDATPQVTGQIFDTLLAIERDQAVPFVTDFLNSSGEANRSEAALSLGTSRLDKAAAALMKAWEEILDPDLRLVILRGLAISRLESALDFLIRLVKDGRTREACAAVEALSVARDSDEIRKRAEDAGAQREPEVREAVRTAFATPGR